MKQRNTVKAAFAYTKLEFSMQDHTGTYVMILSSNIIMANGREMVKAGLIPNAKPETIFANLDNLEIYKWLSNKYPELRTYTR